jgi:hypothetical protein
MTNPTTFKAESGKPSGMDWDDHATLHRGEDSAGVLSKLKIVRQGTLAELVRFVLSLPEGDRETYVIQKAGDHALKFGEIEALSRRPDFPG